MLPGGGGAGDQKGAVLDAAARPCLLVVDDHRASVRMLEEVLAPLGHEVVAAASGEEALARLAQRRFVLVVLDVNMPGLDGFATARLMKAHPRGRDIPIVFLTGAAEEAGTIFRAYAQGGVDYLTKPVDAEMLRAKVRVFVELHLKTEEIRQQAARLAQHERQLADQRYADLAERSARRPAELLAISAALSGALTPVDVGRVLRERARVAVDAGAAAVLHQPVGSDALQVVHAIGFESDELRALASAAPADHGAAPRVATRDSLRPGSALASASAAQPLLSAPLLVDGARGWLVLALLPGREIAEPDRVFCQVLARQCEQALQRSFLFQAEADARRLAERATRSRDEMLAVVSHDLRNPLSTIQMSAEQLDPAPGVPAPDAERTRRLAQRIRRSADRMDHLIRGLLDLASLDAGQFSVNREPTDLCALLRDAQAAMVPQGQASGIALALDCDEPLPEVVCDRRRIQQVLANLVGNAFKFTPAGGTVTVVATARTGHIAVSVRDDGAGIAPAHLSRVFDRFWQLEKAGRGVGLGLSIVRALVEAHGGRVGVDSVPGAGSTFWFTLPCGLAAAS